jgi:hypothetical protein
MVVLEAKAVVFVNSLGSKVGDCDEVSNDSDLLTGL